MHGLMGDRLLRWLDRRGRQDGCEAPKEAVSPVSHRASECNSSQRIGAPKTEELVTTDGNLEVPAVEEAAPGGSNLPDARTQGDES